ncbi:hypothetical protein M8C21_009809 [Ambrosia artemisiifolia]|uniref:Uncharacterized protein n=1 Tax=Ambrosia artemisiifolia TaxID=4212 RepID=A0AAD5GQJ9_AMBAR|nr:hypothetical protein M8C21_009809 [Ambrosia artemisiifolia]
MHHLLGAQPHHALRHLAKKLGPILYLQLGEVSTIVISSPSYAKEIMKTHDLSFANRPKFLSVEILSYNYKDIAFAPYGDYWREMRKLSVLELLSSKKVNSFQHIREQESWNLVESIAMHGSNPIDLTIKIFTMVNTITSRVSIGSKYKDQARFIALIKESVTLINGFDVSDLFPSMKTLHVITGIRKKLLRVHKDIDEILDNIIYDAQRRRSGAQGKHASEALIDVLLRLKDEDDGGQQFSLNYSNIKALIIDMFVAGTDTSSVTIEWALSELIKNPREMKKVQNEIRYALKGKERIQESDIQELKYLKLVIRETLRLHPPLPFLLPRECREACEIGGYRIPLHAKIIINVWKIGRDPDCWNDPDNFIPERFSESSYDMDKIDFGHLPFGAGRRMCPGMSLGMANVELPLAVLLYHFNWDLPNGATSKDLDMSESFGAAVTRKNHLLLVPRPHNPK